MEFVEKNYGKLPTQQIAGLLGRGIPAVRAMALKLGIGRAGVKPWSPAEIEVVKNHLRHFRKRSAGVMTGMMFLSH